MLSEAWKSGTFRARRRLQSIGSAAEPLPKEYVMSSTTDKIKGMANEAAGKVKQVVGKAVGNDRLEVEGAIQKNVGKAQEAVGRGKDAVKKVIDRA